MGESSHSTHSLVHNNVSQCNSNEPVAVSPSLNQRASFINRTDSFKHNEDLVTTDYPGSLQGFKSLSIQPSSSSNESTLPLPECSSQPSSSLQPPGRSLVDLSSGSFNLSAFEMLSTVGQYGQYLLNIFVYYFLL